MDVTKGIPIGWVRRTMDVLNSSYRLMLRTLRVLSLKFTITMCPGLGIAFGGSFFLMFGCISVGWVV